MPPSLLAAAMVATVGAAEIAVHGWDVAAARGPGRGRPIPAALATGLLDIVPLVITGPAPGGQFAAPVPVPRLASPSDRLVACLGRDPRGIAGADPPVSERPAAALSLTKSPVTAG